MNKKGKERKGKTILVSVIKCHLLTLIGTKVLFEGSIEKRSMKQVLLYLLQTFHLFYTNGWYAMVIQVHMKPSNIHV